MLEFLGDCSAYKNRTSCLEAYSLYGCVRHQPTGRCIGAQEAQSYDDSKLEKPVCPGIVIDKILMEIMMMMIMMIKNMIR